MTSTLGYESIAVPSDGGQHNIVELLHIDKTDNVFGFIERTK